MPKRWDRCHLVSPVNPTGFFLREASHPNSIRGGRALVVTFTWGDPVSPSRLRQGGHLSPSDPFSQVFGPGVLRSLHPGGKLEESCRLTIFSLVDRGAREMGRRVGVEDFPEAFLCFHPIFAQCVRDGEISAHGIAP